MAVIPVDTDLVLKSFSGAGITEYSSGITNGLIQNLGNQKTSVTQRSSIDIFEDATSVSGLNDRGRGIYFWEQNSTLYFVEDNTVYRDDYSTVVGTISAGSQKVTFVEGLDSTGNSVLILIDAENNNAKKVTLGHTLTAFAPTNFPTTLTHGGVILNQVLYVMDDAGVIYNSATGNVDSFPATGFIEAERDNDKGVYLGRHHESIVALGTRTIEFFYDAANNTGSPLNRRSDLFHNIGCGDGLSVWENGDIIHFLGSDPSGSLGVYKLEKYGVQKISNDTIESYINFNATQETAYYFSGSGLTSLGHLVYILNIFTLPGATSTAPITPVETLVYDSQSNRWGLWDITINGHTKFSVMQWTKRTGGFNASTSARAGEGILHNGDLITINDSMSPLDTLLGFTGYFIDDYIVDGYYTNSNPNGSVNINLGIRTGPWDGGTNVLKFQVSAKPNIEETSNSEVLTLKWSTSTEQEGTFTLGRLLDTSKRQFARQGGKFTKRTFDMTYSGSEALYVYDLELDLRVSGR